jgi:hypothetical protein
MCVKCVHVYIEYEIMSFFFSVWFVINDMLFFKQNFLVYFFYMIKINLFKINNQNIYNLIKNLKQLLFDLFLIFASWRYEILLILVLSVFENDLLSPAFCSVSIRSCRRWQLLIFLSYFI